MSKKSLTVLLAEDDPDDQVLIKDAFSSFDATLYLHVVSDGQSVLDYLQEHSSDHFPCLIVLDYNMPCMNGLETLKELRKEPRYHNIPKVILTTSTDPFCRQQCLANGADKFIVKPIFYQQLVNIARELMEWCVVGLPEK